MLQGDPLALFLFVLCLDYALRSAIDNEDGLTFKRRQSTGHPAEVLPDLDFAADITLLENSVEAAQNLLERVEKACNAIGLYLNAGKAKYIHLHPSSTPRILCSADGCQIECVKDFKYLGGYMNTAYDIKTRI